jgi:hypothetical protein
MFSATQRVLPVREKKTTKTLGEAGLSTSSRCCKGQTKGDWGDEEIAGGASARPLHLEPRNGET